MRIQVPSAHMKSQAQRNVPGTTALETWRWVCVCEACWPANLIQSVNYTELEILSQKQDGGGGGGLAQPLKASHNQKESEST